MSEDSKTVVNIRCPFCGRLQRVRENMRDTDFVTCWDCHEMLLAPETDAEAYWSNASVLKRYVE